MAKINLNNLEFSDFSYHLSNGYTDINSEFIERVASHIADIGKLEPGDIDLLKEYERVGENVREINERIVKQGNITYKQLSEVYDATGLKVYKDASIYYQANDVEQVPFKKNFELQEAISASKNVAVNTLVNLSNTTALNDNYVALVDRAVNLVGSGESTYVAEIKKVVNEYPIGVKVQYPSGYQRRLDSAVRMNVLDGLRSLNKNLHYITGMQFGADGVEIDAHGMCAEDHQDIQGRQFSLEEFEIINGSLARPIGEMNCGHSIDYIVLGVNKATNSKGQLRDMKAYSNEKVLVNGRTMTRYEAGQYLNQIDVEMRNVRDEITWLRNLGDEAGLANRQARLKQLRLLYNSAASEAGLE